MAKVLVVDDDASLTELLVDTLEVIGYEAYPATSAAKALAALSQQQFSLVISDINMPEMSGIELLQEIKKSHADLPVLLITGVGTEELKQQAFKSGADGFLAKPFRINKIEAEISSLLRGLQQRRVLVVDDNEEFLVSLRERLEAANNIVYTATTVAAGLDAVRKNELDLVITDFVFPDGDGIELYQQVKAGFPKLPIILITAYVSAGLLERIKKSGIARFMPKPLDFQRLEKELLSCGAH
ncbi:MAG: response regulator [candidate division Zixibacteria bacterium]|nr:response regulator [candidate division Zixibacteria bacterium]